MLVVSPADSSEDSTSFLPSKASNLHQYPTRLERILSQPPVAPPDTTNSPSSMLLHILYQRIDGEIGATTIQAPLKWTVRQLIGKVARKARFQKKASEADEALPQSIQAKLNTKKTSVRKDRISMHDMQSFVKKKTTLLDLYYRKSRTEGEWLKRDSNLKNCAFLNDDMSSSDSPIKKKRHRFHSRVSVASRNAPVNNIPTLIFARKVITMNVSVIGQYRDGLFLSANHFTIDFDSDITGEQAVEKICSRINIQQSSYHNFAIRLCFPQTHWVSPGIPLYDSISFNCPEVLQVTLRSRFLLENATGLAARDPIAFGLVYAQAVDTVTTGHFHCTAQHAALFGALLLVTNVGSYDTYVQKAATVGNGKMVKKVLRNLYQKALPQVVPPQFLLTRSANKIMLRNVEAAHRALRSLTRSVAMLAYLNLMGFGWLTAPKKKPREYEIASKLDVSNTRTDIFPERSQISQSMTSFAEESMVGFGDDDPDYLFSRSIEIGENNPLETDGQVEDRNNNLNTSKLSQFDEWCIQRFKVRTKNKIGRYQLQIAEINVEHDILELYQVKKKKKKLEKCFYAVNIRRVEEDIDDLTLLRVTNKKIVQSIWFMDANERQKFYSGIYLLLHNAANWLESLINERNLKTEQKKNLHEIHHESLAHALLTFRKKEILKKEAKRSKNNNFTTKENINTPKNVQQAAVMQNLEHVWNRRSIRRYDQGTQSLVFNHEQIEDSDEDEEDDQFNETSMLFFVATLNMAKNVPRKDVKANWIPLGMDLYAIASQENKYKPRKPYADCETDWVAVIKERLGNTYKMVECRSMSEIKLVVLIRSYLVPFVTNIESSFVATGVAGVGKNKGGVGISFKLFNSYFAFINCHLAARPSVSRMKLRNENAIEILRRLNLGAKNKDPGIKFHAMWCFGDANYRITGPSREKLISLIDQKKWPVLMKYDQLTKQKEYGNVFFDMEEGKINWRPSYRYSLDSDEWSKKKLFNLPSYTDRVLHRAKDGVYLKNLSYDMIRGVFGSDHKPVGATYKIKVWKTNAAPTLLTPSFYPIVVVRLYGLVIDIYRPANEDDQKGNNEGSSSSSIEKKTILRRVLLNSPLLKNPCKISGEYIVGKEKSPVLGVLAANKTVLPIPKNHRCVGRFIADDIVTACLGSVYPNQVEQQFLTMSVHLSNSDRPSGVACISLRGAAGPIGTCDPVPISGHFTLYGIPCGCYNGWVVAVWNQN